MAEKGVESGMMDEDPMDLGVAEDEKIEAVGTLEGIGLGLSTLPIGIMGRSKEDVEDGECSSLSDTNESGMEIDTGILADAESSPISRTTKKSRFVRSLSKFATESQSDSRDKDSFPDLVKSTRPERGPRQYPNPYTLQSSEEGRKRAERAKRFHDSPYKFEQAGITAGADVVSNAVSDEELLSLYKNCGLFAEDWGEPSFDKVGSHYRLDSILIRGINRMSTEEIFAYLFEIGLVPQAMEWVNDACCIAVYKNNQEAAASLLKVTKPISVDHEVVDKKKNLDIEDKPIPEEGEGEESNKVIGVGDQLLNYESASVIPHEKISVPMPLGHVWRYAKPCQKASGILMRFATNQDRKQERAERFSEYYKKHGNPNNPNYRLNNEEGFRKKRPFKRARYNPSPEVSSSEEDLREVQKFSVWTKLSADWHAEEDGGGESSRPDSNLNVRANTPMPRGVDLPLTAFPRISQMRRLQLDQGAAYSRPPAPIMRRRSIFDKLDKPRKRGWQPEVGNLCGHEKQFFTAGHDSDEEWTSRLKGPTMRMHADAEESRQKLQATRKKIQQQSQSSSISSRLGDRVERVTLDADDDEVAATISSRPSVKDRLGARQPFYRTLSNRLNSIDRLNSPPDYDEGEGEAEVEAAYLQSLLEDK